MNTHIGVVNIGLVIYVYVYMYVYARVCIRVCMYVYMYVYGCVCMCIVCALGCVHYGMGARALWHGALREVSRKLPGNSEEN